MEKKDNDRTIKSLKLLAKSSLVVFIGIFLSKVFSYAYRIVIAREFGPEIYGIFSLATMVLGIFILFSSLGLGEGLSRFIPLYRGKKEVTKIKYLVRRTFFTFAITGIAATLVMLILSQFLAVTVFKEPRLIDFLIIFSFIIPINLFLTILLSLLRGYEKVGWYSFLSNILIPFTNVLFILILVFLKVGIYSVIISYLIGEVIVLIIAFFVTRSQIRDVYDKRIKSNGKKVMRKVMLYSAPLFLAGMSWKLFKWADSFTIGLFKTASDVGMYNAAVPIGMFLAISSQIFMQLFFPLITRFYSEGDKKTIREVTQQIIKWIFMINLPLLLALIVFPDKFLILFFGAEYLPATNALRFIALGIFSLSFFEVSSRLLSTEGLAKTLLLNIILLSALNVILNLFLVPLLGITGAAISTMVSYTVLASLSLYQIRHHLLMSPLVDKISKVLISAALPFILLIYLKNMVFLSVFSIIVLLLFFSLLYLLLLIAFRAFDKNDFIIMRAFMKKVKVAKPFVG